MQDAPHSAEILARQAHSSYNGSMRQASDPIRTQRPYAPTLFVTMLSATVIALWSTPALAIIARAYAKKSGFDTIWDMGIGPFLYLALATSTLFWLIEESKAQHASPVTMAAAISATTLLAMTMIAFVQLETAHYPDEEYVTALCVIFWPSLSKVLLLFRFPRLGRGIPAMVLTYLILALMLVQTVRTVWTGDDF